MGQTWTIADVKFYVFFAVELFSDQDEVQAALQSRDLASLIPETSKTAALIDDLGAVQRWI